MERMGWSWLDYTALPAFHLDVLKHLLTEDAKQQAHQRALAESRRERSR